MVQQVNLTFTANQNWFLVFDMTQWAEIYDLTQGTFAMHARAAPGAALLYGWATVPTGAVRGVVAYDSGTHLLYVLAPYADMVRLLTYGNTWAGVYDLQYTPGLSVVPGVPLVQDLVGGSLTITNGVTRT